uniref:Uncharacterized protein n=1 Tax=Solanum demissum TaxID=50514 RepID=Q6L3X8_SOLDE|nr:hypothetical protein SDM1_47t00008 [Solanum demissum]
MDKATSTKSRPTIAKLRVELDLAKPRIREVVVEIRNAEGGLEMFTQKVEYEDLPEFCSHCITQGHTNDKCRVVLQRNQSKKVQVTKEAILKGRKAKDRLKTTDNNQQRLLKRLHPITKQLFLKQRKSKMKTKDGSEPQIEGEQTLINTIRDHIKSINNKREIAKQHKAKVQKERMGTRKNKNLKIADLSKLQEEQQRDAESQINMNVNTTRESSRKRKPTAKGKDGEVVKPNFGLDPDLADKIVGNKVKEKKLNSYKQNNSVSIQILDPGDKAVENQNNTWDEDLEMTQVGIEGSKSDDDIAKGYDKTIDFVDYNKTRQVQQAVTFYNNLSPRGIYESKGSVDISLRIGSMGSLERLNFMKQQYNLRMIILQEPMVGPEKIDVFRRKLGYNYCFKNINNKIWIFWSDQVNVNLVQNKEQQGTYVTHLSRACSDHAHLLIKLSNDQTNNIKYFKFLNVWTNHQDFLQAISEAVVQYFQKTFLSEQQRQNLEATSQLRTKITEQDNEMLIASPSIQEVQEATFYIDPDSAPGPDGYSGGFFQSAWSIIQEDLHMAIKTFIGGAELTKFYTHTCLVMILKVESPQYISNNWYSIIVNGDRQGFSKSDDTILFCNGSKETLEMFLRTLHIYENTSGQLINKNKSCFSVANNAKQNFIAKIKLITCMNHQEFPIKYLGCPLISGKKKTSHFNELVKNIINRIKGWHNKLLSTGGRVVLIKHVLLAIPTHLLVALQPTKGTLDNIEIYLARFFWSSKEEGGKHHWIAWRTLCLPFEEGWINIRRIGDVCNAFSYKEIAENEIKRILGRDEVNFWCDNWSQIGPLYKLLPTGFSVHNIMVKEILGNGKWNWSILQNQLPNQIKVMITGLGLNLNNEEQDKPVWSPTSAGNFTVTSAWNICRHKGIEITDFNKIWHKDIPFKMSFLTWKAIINRLPTGAKFKRLGIPLSPTCYCCTNNNIPTTLESAEHIFMIKVENSWENINQIFDVSINHKNVIRVNWIKPPTMFAKLNTDGSCVNGRCGGGGILRNALGQVIMAFTIKLGEGTSSWAEAMSMLHGMQLCIQRGVNMIIGETDSILLAKAITENWSIPWRMYIPVKKIQKMVEEHGFIINHCLREANQPADKLASISLSTDVNHVFKSYANLPSLVKGLVNLDRMNLPTFR